MSASQITAWASGDASLILRLAHFSSTGNAPIASKGLIKSTITHAQDAQKAVSSATIPLPASTALLDMSSMLKGPASAPVTMAAISVIRTTILSAPFARGGLFSTWPTTAV